MAPFIVAKLPATHHHLLLCTVDSLGQLQQRRQTKWGEVDAFLPKPNLKADTFELRLSKDTLDKEGRLARMN